MKSCTSTSTTSRTSAKRSRRSCSSSFTTSGTIRPTTNSPSIERLAEGPGRHRADYGGVEGHRPERARERAEAAALQEHCLENREVVARPDDVAHGADRRRHLVDGEREAREHVRREQ